MNRPQAFQDLERRVEAAILELKAARRVRDLNPTCPIARTAVRAAEAEGERLKVALEEWTA